MAAKKAVISVTLNFTEEDVNSVLKTASRMFGHKYVPWAKLSADEQARITSEFDASEFKTEILDSSADALANDWLCDCFEEE